MIDEDRHVPQEVQSTKRPIFENAVPTIEKLLDEGHGLTLSEIRDYINNTEQEQIMSNKEVKLYLKYFGDKIRFSRPAQRNNAILDFSSKISAEEVADKPRSIDITRDAEMLGY